MLRALNNQHRLGGFRIPLRGTPRPAPPLLAGMGWPSLGWPSCSHSRPPTQGHSTVVWGEWRLGGQAAALAAPQPAPLQRALRASQGLLPARPGAAQPGSTVLPGHRVTQALQDAQGGCTGRHRAAGKSLFNQPTHLSSPANQSRLPPCPPRLWTHWPGAGPSATQMKWTGRTGLTRHSRPGCCPSPPFPAFALATPTCPAARGCRWLTWAYRLQPHFSR